MGSERVRRRIQRLLDQIEHAADQRDWQRVGEFADDILRFDPGNNDALAYSAAAERKPGTLTLTPRTYDTPSPDRSPRVTQSNESTSLSNNRYQVKRFLGEGSKKKVYLASDTLLGRDVAFAIIKSEAVDEVSLTRIKREALSVVHLGPHPHLVTVFDVGEQSLANSGQAGQTFIVTEFMEGRHLASIIEDSPNHRMPLNQTINIALEVCSGLEFAHSRGIVHRDLKPGNVWLTGDGVAKISDFGLAVAITPSRLASQGMTLGMVSYMSPEQAMGGEATPRSDLYSLGAMLYEMVTGQPPFLGDDSTAIIRQHINTPPAAPTWHNPDCPHLLETLILWLLAKDPQQRPNSAANVLTVLESLDLSDSETHPSIPLADRGQRGVDDAPESDRPAGDVFIGHEPEMGELKAYLEDALAGHHRLVTLVGEPGIGKTRTAQELANYARLRQVQVLWGRCYEGQGRCTYWPWVQAISSYVQERDTEQLRSEMGAGVADIAEIVSAVKERFPELDPPPQTENPEQARSRLFYSITTFLQTASQKQPLMLVLDDLHWADLPSLLLLQFASKELSDARVLLVGTYSDLELSRQHPLSKTLEELTGEGPVQQVLLRGLNEPDVDRLIEDITGIVPHPGLVRAVYTQTEGNPLFVTEVMRLLEQEGELTSDKAWDLDSPTVRVPEGLKEVIGRRLNLLSRRCNEVLNLASVIGREFTLDLMKPLVEAMTQGQLLEALQEALSAGVIEELPPAVGRYQFSNALIQEILIDELTLTQRVRLHARIAVALEEFYGDNAEAHAAELAHHFAKAEAVMGPDKLVHYSLLAAEKALATQAHEEALAHFQRGLLARGVTIRRR